MTTPFIIYKEKYHAPAGYTKHEFIQEFEDMEVRDDDIFIATYPKSGTHWMQEVVQLILADGHAEKLGAKERRIIAELCDISSPDMIDVVGPTLREFKDSPSPRVITTHLPCPLLPKLSREKKNKVIYVLRHPKDIVVSYYNFYLKFLGMERGAPVPHTQELFDEFFDDLIGGRAEYGDWFDHIIEYNEHKDDANFLFVYFESMKSDLAMVVQDVSSFIGRELDDAALKRVVEGAYIDKMRASFERHKEKNMEEGKDVIDMTFFISKGKVNQWKDIFTEEQNERFDKTYGEKMRNCGLTASYVDT